jgi:hypothetical protein
MLSRLTKRVRVRVAVALAALYAACVLAPPVALAFVDGAVAAHCLTDDHHGVGHKHAAADTHQRGATHVHADGTVHTHAGDVTTENSGGDESTSTTGACCGLFCFAAATGVVPEIGQPVHASSVLPALDEHLAGCGPERINRPPITFASL